MVSEKNIDLKFDDFINGFSGGCTLLHFKDGFQTLICDKNYIRNLGLNLKNKAANINVFDDMREFASQIGDSFRFDIECGINKKNIIESPIYKELTKIINGRRGLSKLLESTSKDLEHYQYSTTLSKRLEVSAQKWQVIRSMLVKGSILEDITDLKSRIKLKLLELADYEEATADIILGYDNLHTQLTEVNKIYSNLESNKIKEIYYLELDKYFNNNGVGSKSNDNVSFEMKMHFLSEGLPHNILNVDFMKFRFPIINDNLNDNICSEGQTIETNKDKYSCIMILGCADMGSYKDEIEIQYDDGELDKIEICASYWLREPKYGERVAWQSRVIIKEESKKMSI